jgi:prepilin-type N-terminal cleavage/methylation domain-containing protein
MLASRSRRTSSPRTHTHGFTIIELLIVIVVIAILAALSIVTYTGIQNRARETAVQADLSNMARQLGIESAQAEGSYPSVLPSLSSLNSSTSFIYTTDNGDTTFCLTAYNQVNPTIVYNISSSTGIQAGACTGHVVPGGGSSNNNNTVTVSTFAGSGTQGYLDGTGTGAQFNTLRGIAIDSAGNVYVADTNNQRIRKISPSGVVTTLAGSGTAGYLDGTGTAAQFRSSFGIDIDATDTIYVADTSNYRIRKITPGGIVTTLAGSGMPGFADGTGTAAQFNQPYDVAVDSAGNVYVGDWGNHRIRKISPSGVVTTLAGSGTAGYLDGTGTAAQFNQPSGIAIDSTGVVYVADCENHRIRKVTSSGVVTTFAGSGIAGYLDGTGTAAQFDNPCGVAIDTTTDTIYVADGFNNRIRKITPSGVVTTLAGTGVAGFVDGTGTVAQFSFPIGMTFDNAGNLYVADTSNYRIRKIEITP